MKRLFFSIIILILSLSLASCNFGETVGSLLGFDTYDYESEAVVRSVEADSEEGQKVLELLKVLSINSPILPEFDKTSDAVEKCQDAILNYMLSTGFSKYTGNPSLMDEASRQYPGLRILTVIPAVDYENFVYTYFGGNTKLTHHSSDLFTYLDKVSCYSAISNPIVNNVKIDVSSFVRTSKTYKVVFSANLGEVTSPLYEALVIVREDDSMYFKYLRNIEKTAE